MIARQSSYNCLQIQQRQIMSRPNIPKSPTSRPVPLMDAASPKLNRSKSEQKVGKPESTPEKRVRLRDYLFIASTSSQRNSAKRQDLKSTITEKETLKSSINLLKRNKYGLSNSEMYGIVKAEITKQFTSLIQDLKGKLDSINSDRMPDPTSQDLHYLYNIKRLLSDSIRPAVRQMDELAFRRNGNIIKQIINMSLHKNNGPITQQNEEEQRADQKITPQNTDSLIQSLFFGGKSK